MNRKLLLLPGIMASLLAAHVRLCAQTPTDALMMNKGQICVAVAYTHDTWDHYWEGALHRDNGNIGTLTRQTVAPMFALGITDRINVQAALPWVKTEASAGQLAGVQGLQDFGIWAKVKALDKPLGPGDFQLFGVAGFSAPASDYLSDYMPLNLGLSAYEGTFRAIVQYQLDQGFYLRSQAGYHLRSNTEIERDFYYTTHAVYSNEVDVPDAISWDVVAGSWLFEKALRAEARVEGMNSLSGNDIRRQDAPFPANRMVSTRVGAFAQYYTPFLKGLSVLASGSYTVSGRNVGQSTAFTGGIAYQFGLWK